MVGISSSYTSRAGSTSGASRTNYVSSSRTSSARGSSGTSPSKPKQGLDSFSRSTTRPTTTTTSKPTASSGRTSSSGTSGTSGRTSASVGHSSGVSGRTSTSSKSTPSFGSLTGSGRTGATGRTASTSGARGTGSTSGARSTGSTSGARSTGSTSGARSTGSTNGARGTGSTSGSRGTGSTSGARSTGSTSGARSTGSTSGARSTGSTSGTRGTGRPFGTRPASSTFGTSSSSQVGGTTGISSTTPSPATVASSLNTVDNKRIHTLEEQLADDDSLNDAIKYQNEDSARDGVYTESQEFISDTIKELMDENGYSINDIVVAGGADYLTDLSNSLEGYDVSDFNIDKSNMTPDLINIISSAYEKASPEERDSNSLLGQLYAQAKDFVVSQSTNPALYEAYASQMGNIDSGFDNNQQMSLSEMLNDVDRFNQVLAIDPHFYDKYVTPITTKDGKVVYTISDSQRAQMIADENALLGDDRKIVEDSDYTMTNPDALIWNDEDAFFDKFGKTAATVGFVADGGWSQYNELNKEYQDCQNLCDQFNEKGYVIYDGKRYDKDNAQAFINAMNARVDDIQKQKDEIERSQSYNATVASALSEFGWEAAKFGLGIVGGGAVQVTLIAADAAITAHDTIADDGSWDEALVASITNAAGNVLGNAVGDWLFPGANDATTEITERATERLTSEASERIATEVAENIAEATARRIAQETGENISKEATESVIKKFLTEKFKYDVGNEVQSINEDFFNGAYEEIKAELTSESSSEA